eukprot:CAMPEP_0116871662 /NCGR_PEP_ID=MMETSP0463-20121206/2134_1 /TAXON_ID=181622 /ORGANISM="Strombidinopsis sp, Strain SopsisLIS2011" /LENGTH=71 /DNA_ID=CAMNT_0004510551 /DNA_START=68 /DNA_END=283 /DNA_ORIENTATION=+
MLKMNKKFKGPFKCGVKEINSSFLVSDGSYFVEAYFTREAFDTYMKEDGKNKVTDLQGFMLLIDKWSLELK